MEAGEAVNLAAVGPARFDSEVLHPMTERRKRELAPDLGA